MTQITERRIVIALMASTAAALALTAVYVRGGQPQLEGALLAVSLGGMGVAVILWAKHLFADGEVTGERTPFGSPDEEQEAAATTFQHGGEPFTRRRFLTRLLGVAAGAFGIAALFPIRSLGPTPGRSLFRTAWAPGVRVVREDGRPVKVGDVEVGNVLTVFPEGHKREDSATVLVRVEPGAVKSRPGREDWSPEGHVAYSKICTHVGCPVGLYRESTHELLCPCHQSTFNVLDGARPVLGPATRSLPQLPLEVDPDGFLVASSDYTEPVGPAFWNRERG